MPSPPTTDLPRPKSWDEFEDICADVLKRLWKDPYIVRHGRSGQKQHGVDIYGQPEHLGGASSGKYAAAQCKETDGLGLATVEEEVEKAKGFTPTLCEYLVMTTAPRDAQLQQEVRNHAWPFRVHVMFWDDISLELSGHDDLLQKHFPGWMRRTTTKERVLNMVRSSGPEDFDYNAGTGEYFHTGDVHLRIVLDRECDEEFGEPWTAKFVDKHNKRQPVYIYYGQTRVLEVPCVRVDGGRNIIPFPKSASDLTISRFQYHVGCILNWLGPGRGGFDSALECAGISVGDE